jgi:hypothetical protein
MYIDEMQELRATRRQTRPAAADIGLPRRHRKLVALECPALRDIRFRAAEVGLSLRELARKAETGRYFQRFTRRICLRSIVRAAGLFGGEVILRPSGIE